MEGRVNDWKCNNERKWWATFGFLHSLRARCCDIQLPKQECARRHSSCLCRYFLSLCVSSVLRTFAASNWIFALWSLLSLLCHCFIHSFWYLCYFTVSSRSHSAQRVIWNHISCLSCFVFKVCDITDMFRSFHWNSSHHWISLEAYFNIHQMSRTASVSDCDLLSLEWICIGAIQGNYMKMCFRILLNVCGRLQSLFN